MSSTTQLQRPLPPAGTKVTVTKDEYTITGHLIGLTQGEGAQIRVLGADGLERRVPLPASVTPAA